MGHLRHALVTFLEGRFGTLEAELRERIEALRDPDELARLAGRAAKAASLKEFVRDLR